MPALPQSGGLQPQVEGTAPKEAVQTLGADLAIGDVLGT